MFSRRRLAIKLFLSSFLKKWLDLRLDIRPWLLSVYKEECGFKVSAFLEKILRPEAGVMLQFNFAYLAFVKYNINFTF